MKNRRPSGCLVVNQNGRTNFVGLSAQAPEHLRGLLQVRRLTDNFISKRDERIRCNDNGIGPRLCYGLGETVGAAFLLKISGSCVSLKLAGTVNSLSAIESRLTPVTVVVISVRCPESLAPCSLAWFSLSTIMRIRIGNPGKSRKSGIFVFAASQSSDLIDWSCARTAPPFGYFGAIQ